MRIAALARALIWSGTFATASSKQLGQWSDEVETFPESVRAGPYYVLGRALAHHKQPADAALDLLACRFSIPGSTPGGGGIVRGGAGFGRRPQAGRGRGASTASCWPNIRSRPADEMQQRLESNLAIVLAAAWKLNDRRTKPTANRASNAGIVHASRMRCALAVRPTCPRIFRGAGRVDCRIRSCRFL